MTAGDARGAIRQADSMVDWKAPSKAAHPARDAALRSYDAVCRKAKDEWLDLFTTDGWIEDPVGRSVFDPEGAGHHGRDGRSAFWDKTIANVDRFVFEIGTPWLRRGHNNLHGLTYRVYRVQKPVRGRPVLFDVGPIGSDTPPPETGMGYSLVDSIADLVASGHLVEITGPGGEPGATVHRPEEQP